MNINLLKLMKIKLGIGVVITAKEEIQKSGLGLLKSFKNFGKLKNRLNMVSAGYFLG